MTEWLQIILFSPVIAAGILWQLITSHFEAGREFARRFL
jgi:hypothetical protein